MIESVGQYQTLIEVALRERDLGRNRVVMVAQPGEQRRRAFLRTWIVFSKAVPERAPDEQQCGGDFCHCSSPF